MRGMRHIAVDRGAGAASYAEAVRYLRDGELVGVFPEATISRSFELKEFKSGTVRMAAEAGVPIVPVILWGTQRLLTKDHPRDLSRGKTIAITVGEPVTATTGDDPREATERLRTAMAAMLDRTITAYPAAEQPPGSWWLPASYGGSAPTPERAATSTPRRRPAAPAPPEPPKPSPPEPDPDPGHPVHFGDHRSLFRVCGQLGHWECPASMTGVELSAERPATTRQAWTGATRLSTEAEKVTDDR